MTTKYIVKGHADGETGPAYNWDESYAGNVTIYYDSRAAAEAAIEELRKGGPDFAEADWRAFPVEVDD